MLGEDQYEIFVCPSPPPMDLPSSGCHTSFKIRPTCKELILFMAGDFPPATVEHVLSATSRHITPTDPLRTLYQLLRGISRAKQLKKFDKQAHHCH